MKPLFSCVMPVKGKRPFLEEALASLRSQGMGDDLEIVVQDGDVEPDGGQSDALNKGFAKARGEWLFWLNSDDILLPGALKKVAALIERGRLRVEGEISHVHSIEEVEKHREGGGLFRLRPRQSAALPNGDGGFAIASTPTTTPTTTTTTTTAATTTTNNYTSLQWIVGNELFIDADGARVGASVGCGWHDWLYQHSVPHVNGPSAFFRRDLLARVGGIDTSLDFCMDWDLWIRFMQAGARQHRINAFLWAQRRWAGSKTQREVPAEEMVIQQAEIRRMLAKNHFEITRTGIWLTRIWRMCCGCYLKAAYARMGNPITGTEST